MAQYESEFTSFMREMLARHPEWVAEQDSGRALLWDRKVDLAEQEAFRAANVPQHAYPYDVNCPQK